MNDEHNTHRFLLLSNLLSSAQLQVNNPEMIHSPRVFAASPPFLHTGGFRWIGRDFPFNHTTDLNLHSPTPTPPNPFQEVLNRLRCADSLATRSSPTIHQVTSEPPPSLLLFLWIGLECKSWSTAKDTREPKRRLYSLSCDEGTLEADSGNLSCRCR